MSLYVYTRLLFAKNAGSGNILLLIYYIIQTLFTAEVLLPICRQDFLLSVSRQNREEVILDLGLGNRVKDRVRD